MSYSNRQQRGPYATNACTNCRKKHAKCSEDAICTNCASHNLKCIYVKSIKKRGPKAANISVNIFESNSGKASNIEQEHTLILSQFGIPIPICLNYNYSEEFLPIQNGFFPYINTNYSILNNDTPINFVRNTFSLSSLASNLDY
ncbi:27928_t:CDS:1 [Racocetra persica]|uniref:27928_t:CDS:1 n=1 Tax=Racocetra persica TaxID=160502 RepID=A0ACA9MFA7_9GLOM|nr:27928_t:CDS:1 [Racocetra persica]